MHVDLTVAFDYEPRAMLRPGTTLTTFASEATFPSTVYSTSSYRNDTTDNDTITVRYRRGRQTLQSYNGYC